MLSEKEKLYKIVYVKSPLGRVKFGKTTFFAIFPEMAFF